LISGGNIYSFATTNTFTLTDSTSFTLGTVVLQLRNNDGSSPFDSAPSDWSTTTVAVYSHW
jgi:hypothetical protein